MTKKLENRFELPKTDLTDAVKKVNEKHSEPDKKVDSEDKKETPDKKEEEDKISKNEKELGEVFSKSSELYDNILKDNSKLREKSLTVLDNIELVINSILQVITENPSPELLKSFSAVLKVFNETQNSLADRNNEVYNNEIEIFKNKLEILKEYFKKVDNKNKDESGDNQFKKETLENLINQLKKSGM